VGGIPSVAPRERGNPPRRGQISGGINAAPFDTPGPGKTQERTEKIGLKKEFWGQEVSVRSRKNGQFVWFTSKSVGAERKQEPTGFARGGGGTLKHSNTHGKKKKRSLPVQGTQPRVHCPVQKKTKRMGANPPVFNWEKTPETRERWGSWKGPSSAQKKVQVKTKKFKGDATRKATSPVTHEITLSREKREISFERRRKPTKKKKEKKAMSWGGRRTFLQQTWVEEGQKKG